jgi:hypothetical protein
VFITTPFPSNVGEGEMMNTKYSTKYSVTFWVTKDCEWSHEAGEATRDSIVEDNLTDALQFVRDVWPDATLNGSPEGIDATQDGQTVAKVREHPTVCMPSRS